MYSASGVIGFPWLSVAFSILQVANMVAKPIKSCKIMNLSAIKKMRRKPTLFSAKCLPGQILTNPSY